MKTALGVDIKIYDQAGSEASDEVTLGSIRSRAPEKVEVRVVGQTLVRNVVKFFEKNHGINIEILNGDGLEASADMTLGSVKNTYLNEEISMAQGKEGNEMNVYSVAENILENKEISDILEKFCDKVMENGSLAEYVGADYFDFMITIVKFDGSYFVAADVFSDVEGFEASSVNWEDLSSWVIDELTDREFFVVLDDLFGVDAYTEKAICMSGGELINDWGYN